MKTLEVSLLNKILELHLKVKEAKYRDVGKGIARISKKNMNELGVLPGDVVELQGQNSHKTTALIWPAYSDNEDNLVISIDATTRTNAGVRLDEVVIIRKGTTLPAIKVVLVPTSNYVLKGVESFFYQKFQNRTVSLNDKIRLEYMGQRIEYQVVNLTPNRDSVFINEQTIIEAGASPSSSVDVKTEVKLIPKISYEDIGGIDDTIQRVREMVELPMRYPELFERLGVEPPKGVLLYGPPGTGKTLLAKAVASESESHFVHVSGPEIMSKFYGESEARLREIFEESKEKTPSIIFIDEIDSIAPKRDDKNSGEVERRVVSQMLALMDGLETRGEVIVIGATNRPNAIDPALRRPGRFDREIELGVPNKNGRLNILEIHTRSMPLAENVNLGNIAERTHGFVGADLASLTKEAAMHAIRRIFPKIIWGEEIPIETISQISVRSDDFNLALSEIKPSALREVFVEIPMITWDQVGGLDDVKQELKEIVEWPSKYPALFDYMNTVVPRGILLIGPPGTGKTLLVRAIANESSRNFISVKGSEVISKWAGESEQAISEIFRKARIAAPSIVFFDEIDTIVPSREGNSPESGLTERIVTAFLTEMDGLEELNDVTVIAASNRPDAIDEALVRPGRFERVIELPLPDEKAREDILQIHTKGKPLSSEIKLSDIAAKTDSFSGADLRGLVSLATFSAIERFLHQYKNDLDKFEFDQAIEYIKSKKLEITLKDISDSLEYLQSSEENDAIKTLSYK